MTALSTGTASALCPAATTTSVPFVMAGEAGSADLATTFSAIILGIVISRSAAAPASACDDHSIT
jgi:hypothetical protein